VNKWSNSNRFVSKILHVQNFETPTFELPPPCYCKAHPSLNKMYLCMHLIAIYFKNNRFTPDNLSGKIETNPSLKEHFSYQNFASILFLAQNMPYNSEGLTLKWQNKTLTLASMKSLVSILTPFPNCTDIP